MPLEPIVGNHYKGSLIKSFKERKDKPNDEGRIRYYREIHCIDGNVYQEEDWLDNVIFEDKPGLTDKHPKKKIVVKSFIKGDSGHTKKKPSSSSKKSSTKNHDNDQSTAATATAAPIPKKTFKYPDPHPPAKGGRPSRKSTTKSTTGDDKRPSRNVSMGEAQPMAPRKNNRMKPSQQAAVTMNSMTEEVDEDEHHEKDDAEQTTTTATDDNDNKKRMIEEEAQRLEAALLHPLCWRWRCQAMRRSS